MLLLFALVTAVFGWLGEIKKIKWLIFFSKPIVFIFLMAWIFIHISISEITSSSEIQRLVWFVVGLFFCLVSDIFFMFPTQSSIPSLIASLISQVLLIIGFQPLNHLGKNIIPSFVILFLTAIVTQCWLSKILKCKKIKKQNNLKILVLITSVSISFMLYSSVYTLLDNSWNYQDSFLVSIGAVAYYFSEQLKAWILFVGNISAGRLKQMITYHIGLILFFAGVVFHFNNL